ncbi:MAG TPA: UDP-N-acetylglucosamine 2-epimerase (non-hydrolyzing) [Aeromicrobium sp.]|nr:UDP-N-acetylglucosamine 2-epimerase (non-hydrolyzing) [Aeromicrobium sp.]HKY56846.1 UDP-N-acetylglucosamine 2-epimerase (non-hydrolyzing) [Aeromicrobium sp.]
MSRGSAGEPKTVMVVYGTRPEAIKLAPLIRALAASEHLEPWVVVTGQHREMLDQVNALFDIVPDVDLDLMAHGASVNAIARRVLRRVEEEVARRRPDALVVQGDTTSAFAASLAAFLEDIPVIHLEAGLRTGNRRSPFPEEANRQLTAVVTDLHLAPTSTARANLEAEGIDPSTIVVTGNTVVDALQWAVEQPVTFVDPLVEKLGSERDLILVTTHRREAWGDRMLAAMRGLGEVARNHPELDLLLPMHRNPIVRDSVVEALGHLPNVYLTEPLSYAEFCHVMKRSRLIVTDSGGVQEEAPSLGKPVLVLRDTTERPEGVEAGTVKVVGTDQATVTRETERLLTDPDAYAAMANAVNPYGDGHAAARAVQAIEALLIGGERPEEFRP